MVQAREVANHFDLDAVAVEFQLSPTVLFLAALFFGLVAIAWLVAEGRRGRKGKGAGPIGECLRVLWATEHAAVS
jgi:hypothetical protein